jgi:cytoskeleton protein RodZ
MEERTQIQIMTPKQPPTLHLGSRLKSARELLNLSEKDAALRLHLNIKYIHMMENDKYEGLPPTFVRGYLKSYAKLLNIPEREINSAFTEFDSEFKPVQTIPTPSAPTMVRKTKKFNMDRYIYWASYLIVIGMIALAGIWWSSHNKNSSISDGVSDSAVSDPSLSGSSENTAQKAPEGLAPQATTVIPTAPTDIVNPPVPPAAAAPAVITPPPATTTPKTADSAATAPQPPTQPPVAQPSTPPLATTTPPSTAPSTQEPDDLSDLEMLTPEPGLNSSDSMNH